MNKQKDLEGNEANVKKKLVKKTTIKYTADFFTVAVSEAGNRQLDKLHEEGDEPGIRRWIAKNMKVRDKDLLPLNEEGTAFQGDLEKFLKVL